MEIRNDFKKYGKSPSDKYTIPLSPGMSGRHSSLDLGDEAISDFTENKIMVLPKLLFKVIPLIKKLSVVDDNLSLALNDLMLLTNTGHNITFDPDIKPELVVEMKEYLNNASKTWVDGVANADSLVNKFISQAYLTGCISNEYVISNNLKYLKSIFLVDPENIRFFYNKRTQRYEPYQYRFGTSLPDFANASKKQYIKLNTFTYKYFAINGFSESPYGIPPWIPALRTISKLYAMDKNVDNILHLMGLMGFLEVKVSKPHQEDGESDDTYINKLDSYLKRSQTEIMKGVANGVVTGFQDDHEFDFHQATRDANGVGELYRSAEKRVSNSLKYPGAFMGNQTTGGTETGLSIVFTKMLSQLRNVQSIVSTNMENIYKLSLTLGGYKFKSLKVEFNPSTITDSLKTEQTNEYKIRNVNNKRMMGIINQHQAANELGYASPAEKEPIGDFSDNKANTTREKEKDASDRKTREKNKEQPKTN